jgi:hypothetical protein
MPPLARGARRFAFDVSTLSNLAARPRPLFKRLGTAKSVSSSRQDAARRQRDDRVPDRNGIADFLFLGRSSRPSARHPHNWARRFPVHSARRDRAAAERSRLNRGFAWNDDWLVLTYALYVLAGACWLRVVAIQMIGDA